ncbi:tol-pal system protein YbgF [Octadecabacter sp. SW4]|uniref:tol-pal system protein YbgF n=1 Tax=Octadecabacter sp. SW4 TaxID=2602067 RepID=UPI0011C1E6C3|nr:tol-pal system protein YbgF [Octadecabacter sp. SW4]QEE36395.1 tol-pal system protein YbgF [Octadecabacter sp. SW4]
MIRLHKWVAILALSAVAGGAFAQTREETLADIRQQLTVLYMDIQTLKTELSTTGAPLGGVAGNSPLERLTAIEAELQRLTSATEQLDFRVSRITQDGTNRIGDLEFRLCELEEGCDIAALGDTPSLGGVDAEPTGPGPVAPPPSGGPSLAIGEQEDFERAQAALAAGDFRSAADQFATFVTTYPGGPLAGQAHFYRGEALTGLGETTNAARAYLESFSGESEGPVAPDALYNLGKSLGAIGQTQDACITLAEVAVRFPGNPAVLAAQSEMRNLGCS